MQGNVIGKNYIIRHIFNKLIINIEKIITKYTECNGKESNVSVRNPPRGY